MYRVKVVRLRLNRACLLTPCSQVWKEGRRGPLSAVSFRGPATDVAARTVNHRVVDRAQRNWLKDELHDVGVPLAWHRQVREHPGQEHPGEEHLGEEHLGEEHLGEEHLGEERLDEEHLKFSS
jgi:hypothetical protein